MTTSFVLECGSVRCCWLGVLGTPFRTEVGCRIEVSADTLSVAVQSRRDLSVRLGLATFSTRSVDLDAGSLVLCVVSPFAVELHVSGARKDQLVLFFERLRGAVPSPGTTRAVVREQFGGTKHARDLENLPLAGQSDPLQPMVKRRPPARLDDRWGGRMHAPLSVRRPSPAVSVVPHHESVSGPGRAVTAGPTRTAGASAGSSARPESGPRPGPEKLEAATKRSDLTEEQRKVLRRVAAGESVFFTGSAGTGKSFLLRLVVSCLPEATTHVTASTGVAAVNIGGTTLNYWAGVGGGDGEIGDVVRRVGRNREALERWRSARTLVIDEISMVSGELFDRLEHVARLVRQDKRPFGGLQLVVCGDFFQLPPVQPAVRGRDTAAPKFAFEASAWEAAVGMPVELSQVFRQEDEEFVRVLNQLRRGTVDAATESFLMARAGRPLSDGGPSGILPTVLLSRKSEVDQTNERHLAELPGEPETFRSKDAGDAGALAALDASCPARAELVLRPGAQVMLVRNLDVARGLCNGSRGVVIALSGCRIDRHAVVRFSGGIEMPVRAERFTSVVAGTVVASREQLPLALAWAMSIHKSQGIQLNRAVVSLGSCWEHGQAYVALSRVRSLDGLHISSFSRDRVKAHPAVVRYYRSMSSDPSCDLSENENGGNI